MEPICGAQAALFVKPNSCLPLVQQPSCFLLLPSLQTLRGLQATAYSNCYSMLFYFILFYSILFYFTKSYSTFSLFGSFRT